MATPVMHASQPVSDADDLEESKSGDLLFSQKRAREDSLRLEQPLEYKY
jgi:hypothetical protein